MITMEKLKCIKHKLVDAVYDELSKDIHCINTAELGEVIDMIKDISKAMYYCSVVEEREDSKNKETSMDGKMITTDVIK